MEMILLQIATFESSVYTLESVPSYPVDPAMLIL